MSSSLKAFTIATLAGIVLGGLVGFLLAQRIRSETPPKPVVVESLPALGVYGRSPRVTAMRAPDSLVTSQGELSTDGGSAEEPLGYMVFFKNEPVFSDPEFGVSVSTAYDFGNYLVVVLGKSNGGNCSECENHGVALFTPGRTPAAVVWDVHPDTVSLGVDGVVRFNFSAPAGKTSFAHVTSAGIGVDATE